ncbi:MAG: branched-chain amino acid ABC transporter permease [Candidatus Sungbacteria bacterium]|nr:branched-chain amino acid ABC transporter permease [Candidatus Sungbacteria bacterium]
MYATSIILQGLILGTQILMVAAGLYLVSASSRIMHLGIGAIGAASAYILYWGIISEWPLFAAILWAIFISALLGILSAELLEPFAARREPLLGLLVSFALGIIIESLIAIFFGTDGKNLYSGILSILEFKGVEIDTPGVITIILGAALAFFLWFTVQFTAAGRILRGVAENSTLATSYGINNKTVRRFAYMLSALVGALVIILAGWHTALTPGMGFQLVIAAFIALLMGGIADLRGTAVASYVIAVIPGLIIGFSTGFSENWRMVFVFVIAVVALALRPHGLFAKRTREA